MTSIFRRSRAANSVVSGGICPKFKLIQAFMYALITCKYEKDPIKNSRENVMKFELIQDIMHVLITCKFEKDRINSNGEKVVTSIF